VTDRTCTECGTDISGLHGNAKRCVECREKNPYASKGTCTNGCDAPVLAAGLCGPCYRIVRHDEGRVTREENQERFWLCVDKDGPVPPLHPEMGPCWLWTGRTTSEGFGTMQADHRWAYAYRFSYELLIGPIPGKRRVVQACEVPQCVNPAHLLALSARDEERWKRRNMATVAESVATDPDLAYWGGLVDGEGHIGIAWANRDGVRPRYTQVFALRMTERPIIQAFATKFGTAVSPRVYKNALSVLPIYETACGGHRAVAVVSTLLPYLRVKGGQAELLVKLHEEKQMPGLRAQEGAPQPRRMRDGNVIMRRPTGYSSEHLERWHSYYLKVRSLNKPGRDWDAFSWPGVSWSED
jgi:hypothetical protein